MHKLRKAAVLVAALGSVGLLGAGAAHADGDFGKKGSDISVLQSSSCKSHDANVDILGQVGIANGLGGNLLNGEGSPGAQETSLGSSMGCDNSAFGK
ncbi:hypothetical protein [Streptomyces sp. NPDC056479]|uniref:hypothetical protein n=1 Tax=unclassified Streptomyces TaxID=2593676 RepID=UPI00368566BE